MDVLRVIAFALGSIAAVVFVWWLLVCSPCLGQKASASTECNEMRFIGLKDGMPKFAAVCPD